MAFVGVPSEIESQPDQVGIYPVTRAVFFDRDGVINQALVRDGHPFSPASWNEFSWVEGIKDVTATLKDAGYMLFCVTNQPDVGRGIQGRSVVEALHQHILEHLPLEKIYTCYHDDRDGCTCRKPQPGMIFMARDQYGLNLDNCWLVGDRWKDIDAGNAVGCQTVFLDYGYDEALRSSPDYTILKLSELTSLILKPVEQGVGRS